MGLPVKEDEYDASTTNTSCRPRQWNTYARCK